MESKIRELRLEVDKFINSTGMLNPSREVSLCHTQLQRAKSWLGMVLGEIGGKNPYPHSNDPTTPVIEPQAEHQFETIWPCGEGDPIDLTQIAHVKFFRGAIGTYQKRFAEIISAHAFPGDGYEYLILSRNAMIEAKHWLGWELDRIRKEKAFQEAVANGIIGTSPGRQLMPL